MDDGADRRPTSHNARMMTALTWRGGTNLTVDRVDRPEPGPGQIAFDVALTGICGSDMHPYRGHAGPRVPPLVLGHEAVGTTPDRPGERFVLFPLVGCGECAACVRGEVNLCSTRGLVGLDRQGTFADRVVAAADALTPVPQEMTDLVAVMCEPLATPVSALRYAGATAGDRVVVLGGGPIGLLAVHACVVGGMDVVLVEPVDERRAFGAALGASATFGSVDEVAGFGADLAIDAVGIEPTWQAAITAVRMGGSVTIVGLGQAEGRFSAGDVVRRGVTVRGHYGYTRADFDAALGLLATHPPSLDWVRSMPLSEGAEGFRLLVEAPAANIKIVLEPAT
jgi:threonine dehydrogenase-like Zn-dependent dehydrogenase